MASSKLFTYGPDYVDSLLTTTKSVMLQMGEYLNDAVFSKIPILRYLEDKARVTKQGGASILVAHLTGANDTFAAYSKDDTFNTMGQEGMTLSQATWRNYGGTIRLLGDETRQNAGSGKLHDLMKAKVQQAMLSARDRLAIDLHASTQAAKAIQTLVTLIDATSTIQEINSTSNSYWQAQVTASGVFAAQGIANMRTLRDNIAKQGQGGAPLPDMILTTQTVAELYEASQLSALRYRPADSRDASQERMVWGGAPVVFDPNCASGVLYMLSSDALQFVVHSDANWKIGDFIEPSSQDAKIAKVIWMGNLVTNNRRRLGKLTGIS